MIKKMLWIAAVTVSLVCGKAAFAGDKSSCRDNIQNMVQSLNLTDEQKAKVKPILDQLKSNMKENFSQMQAIRDQIKQQVESATMDQATVDSLIDKKTALIGNAMKAKATAKNQIYNMLSEDQKNSYQKMSDKWAKKMSDKWKNCKDQD